MRTFYGAENMFVGNRYCICDLQIYSSSNPAISIVTLQFLMPSSKGVYFKFNGNDIDPLQIKNCSRSTFSD